MTFKVNATEVLSAKVKPGIKELVSVGASYSKTTHGDFISKALKRYITQIGYVDTVRANCKKQGFVFEDIIHGSVRLEAGKLLENKSILLQEFYEEYLFSEDSFEGISAEEVTSDLLERLGYIVEWEEFIEARIKDEVFQRIDAESKEILGISSALLFTIVPGLQKILDVEVSVQIRLFDTGYPISVAKDLELLVMISNENIEFKFDHWQLPGFFEKLNKDEEIWFYTFLHLVGLEFRGRVVSPTEAKEFYSNLFLEPTYTIFKTVKVDNIIKKLIETPKVNPFSMNFKTI